MGLGIAVAGACIATAWLEINGHECTDLWVLVVVMILFWDFKS